jgi:Fe-S cluster assembly protein SufD
MAVTRSVVTRARRDDRPTANDFTFTQEMVPYLSGKEGEFPSFVVDYRSNAWNKYKSLPIPTIQDEAWRRTDLRGLEAGSFRLPEPDLRLAYPTPPAELLQPLAGSDHGGQIVLLPGGDNRITVDRDLLSKGVIFTDLKTAIHEHADVVEKILGKIVRPDEGKFAALAASMAGSGVLVYVPKGVTVDQPLHSVLWGPGSELAYFSHIF